MNLKAAIPLLVKLFGVNLLSKEQTVDKLSASKLFYEDGDPLTIEPAVTATDAPKDFREQQTVNSYGIGVFKLPDAGNVKLLNYGGVRLKRDVLNLDFGCSLFIKTLFRADKRTVIDTENCIPLWSHYWGSGYYDYLFFVYAKFLRISSVLGKEILADIKITYPLVNTAFEKELWQLAGISEGQLIDSRKYRVKAANYYAANTQSWYYQHKTDISLLQQTIQKVKLAAKPEYRRIYVSRAGRRKLTNEDALSSILKDFGFTIMDDKPRTVAEQINIFSNADVIIGPHGAAFTNILWCKPGTQLIELFPKNYYPPYFRALSAALGLKYAAIFEDGIEDTHFSNMNADLTIDPQVVKAALENILAG